jgi:hypothetical protein
MSRYWTRRGLCSGGEQRPQAAGRRPQAAEQKIKKTQEEH